MNEASLNIDEPLVFEETVYEVLYTEVPVEALENETITVYILTTENELSHSTELFPYRLDRSKGGYTLIPPKESKEGFTQIFDFQTSSWSYVEDNRGLLGFNKYTGEPVIVDYLGPLKSDILFETPTVVDCNQSLFSQITKS